MTSAVRHRLEDGRFGGVDPHLVHGPSGMRVWLVEPAGMLTQLGHGTRADLAMARFLAEDATEAMFRRFRPGEEKVLFLHDWVRLEGFSQAARRVATDWTVRMAPHTRRIVVALDEGRPLLRTGLGFVLDDVAETGATIQAVSALQPVIGRLRVGPAPARED